MCMSLNVIGAAWKDFCRLDVIETEKMGWLEKGPRLEEDGSNGKTSRWIKWGRGTMENMCMEFSVSCTETTGVVLMDWDLNNLSMSERPRQLWKVIASPQVELPRAGERVFYFP
ncbi:hypothetical protein SLEP1_g35080 [Rubroshorea leprosula]|uniref:Uncharacterized protein n=1 Tax=Rubroshorea leprosula TaxID=152421 RepID=A0AAV5KME4_9ROSI|nr:hypothetical protein SLEP1_g35080 [Rubroshorea leprosula]